MPENTTMRTQRVGSSEEEIRTVRDLVDLFICLRIRINLKIASLLPQAYFFLLQPSINRLYKLSAKQKFLHSLFSK